MTTYIVSDDGTRKTHKYVVCHPAGVPFFHTIGDSRVKAIKNYMNPKGGDWSDHFAMGYRTKKVILEVQPR